MSRKFHKNNGEPGRFKFIARRGGYHGATFMNMSLGGGGVAAGSDYGPLMPYTVNIAQPGEYRCRLCRGMSACDLECARDLEIAIQNEGPSSVAAFIAEPISVASGVHVPHPEYWPTIREICDKYGVLLICDEVITGFGRTGKWFATEHWGIKPDIFTVAKALTSGYLPIGAAVASKHVADAFIGDASTTFRHLITFGGNPPPAPRASRTSRSWSTRTSWTTRPAWASTSSTSCSPCTSTPSSVTSAAGLACSARWSS